MKQTAKICLRKKSFHQWWKCNEINPKSQEANMEINPLKKLSSRININPPMTCY